MLCLFASQAELLLAGTLFWHHPLDMQSDTIRYTLPVLLEPFTGVALRVRFVHCLNVLGQLFLTGLPESVYTGCVAGT